MTGPLGFIAVGLLVFSVIVKAYTGKILSELRQRYGLLMATESQLQQEMEREEARLEAAEARLAALQGDLEMSQSQFAEMTSRREQVEGELEDLTRTGA